MLGDRGEERLEVVARCDDLDLGPRLEQTTQPLADEVVVLGEHEADRHAAEHTTRWTPGPIARQFTHTLTIDRGREGT